MNQYIKKINCIVRKSNMSSLTVFNELAFYFGMSFAKIFLSTKPKIVMSYRISHFER